MGTISLVTALYNIILALSCSRMGWRQRRSFITCKSLELLKTSFPVLRFANLWLFCKFRNFGQPFCWQPPSLNPSNSSFFLAVHWNKDCWKMVITLFALVKWQWSFDWTCFAWLFPARRSISMWWPFGWCGLPSFLNPFTSSFSNAVHSPGSII